MNKLMISAILLSALTLGLFAAPAVVAASPSTMPSSTRTFAVPDSGGTFSAYGITVILPAGLEVAVPSQNVVEKVTSFSFLLFATGLAGPGPANFPNGTIGVKVFGFEVNGKYTFNPGSNDQVVFMLRGEALPIPVSIRTHGTEFWIWNPMTGVYTDVTARTHFTPGNGAASAIVGSPIFAWVVTSPL